MQIRGYDKRLYKRDFKVTEEEKSFGITYKVEMWDEYGCKRTIYERTKELVTERVYDWWEETEERNEKNKIEQKVLNNLVKKEIKWQTNKRKKKRYQYIYS